ncbi:unnamed protein product [Sphagnum troendelagicum]|uniref:Uncharacterized protein n=1 Tax=Sphagnum troendelagicum TaxID=128251 RepID=A0ABP0US04_9BRYO
MVGVEDRNEDVEEEAPGPSNVLDAAAPIPAPSVEDGGIIFVLEKASLEATKVGKAGTYGMQEARQGASLLIIKPLLDFSDGGLR